MKKKLINKIYLRIYMKYCKLRHKNFLKHYITVYKYKNKIGYFTDAIGISKRDVISKVRVLVYYSGFFDEIKSLKETKKIKVVAIEVGDEIND